MSSFTYYNCPPLEARLSAAQCARNHQRAVNANEHPRADGSSAVLILLRCCVHCPGVEALAKFWSRGPIEIDTGPLLAARAAEPERTRKPYKQPQAPKLGRLPCAPSERRGPTGPTLDLVEIARRLAVPIPTALGRLKQRRIHSLGGEGDLLVYDLGVIEAFLDEQAAKRRDAGTEACP